MTQLFKEEEKPTTAKLNESLRHTQIMLNVMPEYKFYFLICSAFNPEVLESYQKNYEIISGTLGQLLKQDEQAGFVHLFMSTIQMFVNKYPDQKKHASELCLIYYNEGLIEDQYFIKWHGRKARTDKESDLYDRKAEKVMRGLLDQFVEWLQSDADYDEEAGK